MRSKTGAAGPCQKNVWSTPPPPPPPQDWRPCLIPEWQPCSKQAKGAAAIEDITPHLILISNLNKSALSVTFFSVAQSFWNCSQSKVVILPCSMQNIKTISPLKQVLWMNNILQDLSLTWVSGDSLYCNTPPPRLCNSLSNKPPQNNWQNCITKSLGWSHKIISPSLRPNSEPAVHSKANKIMLALSSTNCFGRERFSRLVSQVRGVNKPIFFNLLFPLFFQTYQHDDVIKWKHFPRYWPFVRGIHWSPVNSPHKGHWRGALMFSLICIWIYGWINNGEAGDLRRSHAHFDVTVMKHRFPVKYHVHIWQVPPQLSCGDTWQILTCSKYLTYTATK